MKERKVMGYLCSDAVDCWEWKCLHRYLHKKEDVCEKEMICVEGTVKCKPIYM